MEKDKININKNINNNIENIKPKIENIVCTLSLGCELNLKIISLQVRNIEYNPNKKKCLIMRIKEPKSTAMIYSSGKMILTGTKSEKDCLKVTEIIEKTLQNIGYKPKLKDFQIRNMVGSCYINFQLNLNKLKTKLISNEKEKVSCTYEPEIFPGLIYRIQEPKMSISIFKSGKIIIAGAKQSNQISKAFETIIDILKACKAN